MAAAQPEDNQDVEELLKELTAGELRGNPFSLFARQATLVITGLVHISILLLPRVPPDPEAAQQATGCRAGSCSSGKGAAASSSKDSGPSGSGSGAADPTAELRAAGFPADSSDLQRWERVQGILERTATGGLDWDNCCMYRVTEEGGAAVQPQPPFPLSCTAAYHAAAVARDVVVSNDFEHKGPHFADWRRLYEAGARSMAAAPMYVQQRIVGVLSLASKEPHAFDRCRLVWLLAMVLAPFVSALRYTSQAMEMEGFIQRIMPPLLEQNYLRNTAQKRAPVPASAPSPNGTSSSKGGGSGVSKQARGLREQSAVPATTHVPTDVTVPLAGTAADSVPAATAARAVGVAQAGSMAGGGSDQFAQNAEVLITGAAGGRPGAADLLAPLTPAGNGSGTKASVLAEFGVRATAALAGAAGGVEERAAAAAPPHKLSGGAVGRPAGRATRANGRAAGGRRDAPATAGGAPAVPVAVSSSVACDVLAGGALADGRGVGLAGAAGGLAPVLLSATSAGGKADKPAPLGIGRAAASNTFDPAALDPYLSGCDSDLDWSDFFFNLVSMCIVYAYFSEAAVAGESQAAIVVSMCIAAIDIVLLALRWLWYEQYITAGGAVLQAFQAYRLLVLPVANTWMSWSLLNKLGITPGSAVVAAIGCVVLACLVLGVQMRFFLHAPLQLASVLFAASSTTEVCSRFFSSTTGLGCMSAVSLVQLSLGVFVPTLLVQLLDARSAADKPYYLPHVQAKRWLLNA